MSTQSSTMGTAEKSLLIFQMFCSGNKISIVKLIDENFLLWKFQVIMAVKGYFLENFLESEFEPPLKFINIPHETNATSTATSSLVGTQIPNPEYKIWKRQDRLISPWLLSSMSEDILNKCYTVIHRKKFWATLQEIYSTRCLAQAMQFKKKKLQNIKKGAMSLKEYFLKIQ